MIHVYTLYTETGNEGGVVSDTTFSIPSYSWSSDQQKLIQSGHMTPFGTSDTNTAPAPQGGEMETSVTEVSSVTAAANSSGLRLCSEGFDGLFEGQSTAVNQDSRKVLSGRGRKGKERKRLARTPSISSEVCEGVSGEGVRSEVGEEEEEWMLTRDEVEDIDRAIAEETGWREEEEDGSTEYSTDDELGAGIYMYKLYIRCMYCLHNYYVCILYMYILYVQDIICIYTHVIYIHLYTLCVYRSCVG